MIRSRFKILHTIPFVIVTILFINQLWAGTENAADLYREAFESYRIPGKKVVTELRDLITEPVKSIYSNDKSKQSLEQHDEKYEELRATPEFQKVKEIEKAIEDFTAGKTDLNPIIEKHIRDNRTTLELILKATELRNCNWQLSKPQNAIEMFRPIVEYTTLTFKLRDLQALLLCEARLLYLKGDTKQALDRCISSYRFAQHAKTDNIRGMLTMSGMTKRTNSLIRRIAVGKSTRISTLALLQLKLKQIDRSYPSFSKAFDSEYHQYASIFEKETDLFDSIFKQLGESNKLGEIVDIKSIKVKSAQAIADSYRKHCRQFSKALSMPYAKAIEKLDRLEKELTDDKVLENRLKDGELPLENILISYSYSNLKKFYSADIKIKTEFNAAMTAIEIIIVRAKTGNLPKILPENLPKDLFSGKDFEYRKTGDGFILKCQGKDLLYDKYYEFEFKVPK